MPTVLSSTRPRAVPLNLKSFSKYYINFPFNKHIVLNKTWLPSEFYAFCTANFFPLSLLLELSARAYISVTKCLLGMDVLHVTSKDG